MEVWAHRGFSGLYPENTMLAFEKAVESGCDGIEMDVHLSKDGEPVVIHDESLLRTCGIDKAVSDLTLDELMLTRASKTQGDRFDATIPSFEEFCSFVKKSGTRANIEIKTGIVYYPHIEEKVVALVKKYGIEDQIIFSSFNWLSLVIVKRLLPSVDCGLLFEKMLDIKHLSYLASEAGLNLLHPDSCLIDDEMIKESSSLGLKINAWTVNKEEDIKSMIEKSINGVITNYPDRALKLLNRF